MYLQNPQLNLQRHNNNRSFHSSHFGQQHQEQPDYNFNRQKCTESSGRETSSPTRPRQTPRLSSYSSRDKVVDHMTFKHQNEGDRFNRCNQDKCLDAPSEKSISNYNFPYLSDLHPLRHPLLYLEDQLTLLN
jgi:hypothetical protein